MQIHRPDNLACPLDGLSLEFGTQTLCCANGHSFDVARQGYINLMPVQHKKTKDPGDSKAMVAARTAFLDTGVYQPISDRLNALVIDRLSAHAKVDVVDAGCGEGYYLKRFVDDLSKTDKVTSASFVGMDVSKWACLAAAKRSTQITWLVASNRDPTILPGTVDIILCMFGFYQFAAFKKLLKPGGIIVLVDPAQVHLLELRRIIYPTVTLSAPGDLSQAVAEGFTLVDSQNLQYQALLSAEQTKNLLTMTPHMFRASSQGKAEAAKLNHLEITVDVSFRVLSC